MSSSDPSSSGRVPLRRIAVWLLVASALVVGVALFFRFGRDVSPMLGGGQ